jgi:NarL family two-component system response regulator LiaR
VSAPVIRILVVDDHAVVRKGILALLATEPGIEVVGEASTGLEAVERAESVRPDLVLMDLKLPDLDGVEAMRRIRARRPETQILVLTSFSSDALLFPAVKAGAVGYLLKDARPEELVQAIRDSAAGKTCLTPAVARRLLAEFSRQKPLPEPAEPLTVREQELLRELARGLSNDQIAEALHISEATVRTHVSHILAKLSLTNRTQAALYALRQGLASLDDIFR